MYFERYNIYNWIRAKIITNLISRDLNVNALFDNIHTFDIDRDPFGIHSFGFWRNNKDIGNGFYKYEKRKPYIEIP